MSSVNWSEDFPNSLLAISTDHPAPQASEALQAEGFHRREEWDPQEDRPVLALVLVEEVSEALLMDVSLLVKDLSADLYLVPE